MTNTAFEPLVAASDVEDAVIALLQNWLPTYVWEIERQHGQTPGQLAAPRSYLISSEAEKMPEDQLPAIIVASPGTTDPPLADGDGVYTARWGIAASVMIAARGNRLALRLARLYAAAIRGALIQQQQLDGLALRRVDWLGERYDRLESIDDRTICIGSVDLAAEVDDVLTRHAGPLEPLMPPEPAPGLGSPQWPTVQTTDTQIVKQPLEE